MSLTPVNQRSKSACARAACPRDPPPPARHFLNGTFLARSPVPRSFPYPDSRSVARASALKSGLDQGQMAIWGLVHGHESKGMRKWQLTNPAKGEFASK